jgi:predicted NBD/HSP70 family sugar kinase
VTRSRRIALDIGGTKIAAALVSGASVLARTESATRADRGPQPVVEDAVNLVAAIAEGATHKPVCVAATGRVDNGRVSAVNPATLPGWESFPLADALAERLGRSVRVVNDAHAAAWGEARFGAGRGCHGFAFVTVSTGVGAGVVADGRLLVGARGLAGHVGFVRNHGVDGLGASTLEGRASGAAIALAASSAFGRVATTRDVFARAHAGDAVADRILDGAAHALATALVDLRWVLDPDRVAIGGSVGLAPGFWERLVTAIGRLEPGDPLLVVRAELGTDAGLIGAADLLGRHRRWLEAPASNPQTPRPGR